MKKLALIFLLATHLAGCGSDSGKSGKGISKSTLPVLNPGEILNAGFLVLDSVYNSELMAPWDVFRNSVIHIQPGMRVFTIGRDTTMVRTMEGLQIRPEYYLEQAPPLDVLVIPGAFHNKDSDLEDSRLIDWVRNRGESAQFVLSLRDGAFLLAQAGLLDSLNVTTSSEDIPQFREKFPLPLKVHEGLSFVHQGKFITSEGGALAYNPALYLIELLYGPRVAKEIGKGLAIDWNLEQVNFKRF